MYVADSVRTEKPLPYTVACQQSSQNSASATSTNVTECYPPIRHSSRRRNMKVAALAALGVLVAFSAEAAQQQRQFASPATTCDNDGHCKTASADWAPAVHRIRPRVQKTIAAAAQPLPQPRPSQTESQPQEAQAQPQAEQTQDPQQAKPQQQPEPAQPI